MYSENKYIHKVENEDIFQEFCSKHFKFRDFKPNLEDKLIRSLDHTAFI